MDYFNHKLYLKAKITTLEEAEGAYALKAAWKRVYGVDPSERSLAVLWAKACLETGRFKSIWNYNFGNIKRKPNNEVNLFTMFECGEEVSLSQAQSLVAEDPERIKILKIYSWSNGTKRASINVKPGHLWSQFIAHKTVEDGAEYYLRFVSQNSRYTKAWQKVIEGNPEGYSHELKVAGYYTGEETQYTAGVVRLFNEFMRRKKELMSWVPKDQNTNPSPTKPIANLFTPEERKNIENVALATAKQSFEEYFRANRNVEDKTETTVVKKSPLSFLKSLFGSGK